MTKALLVLAALAALLGLGAAPGFGQTRVFVSGFGSDANPCTLAAPCRSLQQAHDTVAAGGEVVALDSAGYGAQLLVDKSVTITAIGVAASITANSGSSAIQIGGTSSVVVIRGITVFGGPITILQGKSVTVRDCLITGSAFDGITISPSNTIDIELRGVTAAGNIGSGLNVVGLAPPSLTTLLVTNSSFIGNGQNGVTVNNTGGGGSINATLNVVAAANRHRGVQISSDGGSPVVAMVTGLKVVNNGTGGLLASGSPVQVFVDRSQIVGNGFNPFCTPPVHPTMCESQVSWEALNGAAVESYTNNQVQSNNGSSSGITQITPE